MHGADRRSAGLSAEGVSFSLAAFSQNGKSIVAAGDRQEDQPASGSRYPLYLWDAASGEELTRLEGHEGEVHSLAFDSQGERVLSGSDDGTARLWSSRGGQPLAVLRGHGAAVVSAIFSPDGERVLTASSDRTVRLWNAAARPAFPRVIGGAADRFSASGFSPDGERVFTVSNGASVRETASGKEVLVLEKPQRGPAWLAQLLKGDEAARISAGSFSPDGERLLTVAGDTLRVFELKTGKLLLTLKGQSTGSWMRPHCAVFSPDGERVLTAQGSSIVFLAKTPPTAQIWDVQSGQRVLTFSGHQAAIWLAEFSSDGRRVLTVAEDQTGRVWDAQSGKEIAWFKAQRSSLTSGTLSPDGQRAAFTEWTLNASILDVSTGTVARLSGHTENPTSVYFSPDSRLALTVSTDHTARLWAADTGEPRLVLKGHSAPVVSAAFSRDGRLVATCSRDGTARIWEGDTGSELCALPHGEAVRQACFSRDGRRFVTRSAGNTIRIWPLDLLEAARGQKPRELTPEEMESHGTGSREEQAAYRRRWELGGLFEEIEAVGTLPLEHGGRALSQPVLQLLSRLVEVLGPHPDPEEARRALGPLERIAAAAGRGEPAFLGMLAEVQALSGHAREAVATLESAVRRSGGDPWLAAKLEKHRQALLPDLVTYQSVDEALEAPEVLLDEGARWRYLRGRSEPSPAMEWTSLEFDDRAWEEGPSGFGYGDDDDATVLNDMSGSYTTVYVRRRFEIADPGRFQGFLLAVRADDGVVAYLNGVEVGRARAGQPGARLPQNGVADAEAPEPLQPSEFPLEPGAFRAGSNVLALQGLNRSLASSDLSLIPVLWARRLPDPEQDRQLLERFRVRAAGGGEDRLLYLEGRLLHRAGRPGEALAPLERAARAERARPEPVLRLAEALRAAGKPADAEARLRGALEAGPEEDEELWDLWARLQFADLHKSAREVLASFPGGGRGAREGRREDLRWLLSGLVSGGAVRLNCGGEEHRSQGGVVWGQDRFASGGSTFLGAFSEEISGTDDDPLYQTERWFAPRKSGLPGYHLPLPAGRYRVTLHFAEIYRLSVRRRFDVLLEGERVLSGYQPSAAGFATADQKTFETTVRDGSLDVEFVHRTENPKVSALEVVRLGD